MNRMQKGERLRSGKLKRIILSPESLGRLLGLDKDLDIVDLKTYFDGEDMAFEERTDAEIHVSILVHNRFMDQVTDGQVIPEMDVAEALQQNDGF